MRDRDVRRALHKKVLRAHHGDANTLVLDELGLRHGSCRIDIAVVNGAIHGYEIKSDADTLNRLTDQVRVYGQVLDFATLVVGERHYAHAAAQLPAWWGVKVAKMAKSTVVFETAREERQNDGVDPIALVELLWKSEATAILQFVGAPKVLLRRPRLEQYCYLARELELDHLRAIVRQFLKNRAGWRGQRPPSICVG